MGKMNPVHKQKHLVVEMNIFKRSLIDILREDLCLGAYRHCVSHLLNAILKKDVTKCAESC